ncbi:MAG: SH3 domain-containing protein [Clostridiales bacterium]|nr:SH3 domain-containing protein [Clostridiales bacterium]
MKKRDKEKTGEKKPPFTDKKPFDTAKKDELGVRFIERQVRLPFLADSDPSTGEDYGSTEDMWETWGLTDNESSLRRRKRRTLLTFAFAASVFILIFAAIFFILPNVLPDLFKGTNIGELFEEPVINYEYKDPSYRVITKSSVNIMKEADITSQRISQVLYNEPVKVTGEASNGFIRIETQDGLKGFIKADSVISDMSSVEPDLHQFKLVVSDLSKNIMTHASNGTLMCKVMMNTVLYADVKREGVYRVNLPGGDTGWIGSSGVIETDPRGDVGKVPSRYFVGSLLLFVNATYIENGLTMDGISVNGAVYVASEINGVKMPRTMAGQSAVGEEVAIEYDAVSGNIDLDSIAKGDIVFFRAPDSASGDRTIDSMGVCTDKGSFLMISTAETTVRLRTFEADNEIFDRIITIRRIFDKED